MKIVLFSIRPQFVNRIFDGSKTVEFRRVRPQIEAGDIGLVYASGNVKALVGGFRVAGVVSGPPAALWRRWGGKAGTDRGSFMTYFEKASEGHGVKIEEPYRLLSPLGLKDIISLCSWFRAPQSYRFLRPNDAEVRLLFREVRRRINGDHAAWADSLEESFGTQWKKTNEKK